MAVTGRAVVLDFGVYRDIRASPESMTYLMPGMVNDVSAILVATMIFLAEIFEKTRDCSDAASLANSGKMTVFLYFLPLMSSQVSRISCSVGMKTRISPVPVWFKSLPMARTAISIWLGSSFSSDFGSIGEYCSSTGYMRPDTSITGALSKAFENFSVSMVAEVMISLRSFLCFKRVFKIPRIKSILRLRSWASSTMRVSYSFRYGSLWVSARRMPSVMILIKALGLVLSLKRILYPTDLPNFSPSSSAMRFETVTAAILLGWVQPIFPSIPRPAARQNFGIWVVFPEPVSPDMMIT